jgi:hypothetical protein
MQLMQYRTAQILSNENILAAQTGARLTSTKIQRLTDEKIAASGFAPVVTLATGECGGHAGAPATDRGA